MDHPQAAELRAAAARLELALPPDSDPRTRALGDRARDLAEGRPIGMTAPNLLAVIYAELVELTDR